MSGILGIWHRGGRPTHTAELNKCLEQLTPLGLLESASWLNGAVGLGCKSLQREPLNHVATFRQGACVFDGRLDNRPELARSLADHPLATPDCPDSSLALAAYDRFGEAFVEHIEGEFSLAVFDRRTTRLLLARDRLGLRPLCYAQHNETLLFATEAKALLAYPHIEAIPDETMLADFVLYFLADDGRTRTFFQGIRSLPPGHLLIATPERHQVRQYFEFNTTERLVLPSFGDYTGAFHELFVSSVRNRIRSQTPVAVSVSGGLDSSYIFCVAQRLLRETPGLCPAVFGLNYGGPPGTASDESDFVRQLERAYETRIEHVPQRPGFMESAGDEVWHSESPSLEALARLRQAFLQVVHLTGAQRMLTGHWGDQLVSDSDYLVDLLRSRQWRALRQHSKAWGVGAARLTLRVGRDLIERYAPHGVQAAVRRARRVNGAWTSPWFTRRFRRVLLERFNAARLPRAAGSSHAWAIYQQTRLGYHLQCMEWNTRIGAMHGLEMTFPFLDCRLIQFLMSIPGEMQSHNGIPRALMRAAMRGIVPDAIVDRRSKGEFTALGNEGVEHDFATVQEIFGPDALSVRFGYVDGAVLRKKLSEWRTAILRADDAILCDRVLELCGMELLLRRFFSGARPC